MPRYIDADALLGNLKRQYGEELGWWVTVNMSDVGMMIEDAPTVNVAPIADTVKKMQERLHSTMCDIPTKYCERTDYSLSYRLGDWVDDIAKEILEGGDTE